MEELLQKSISNVQNAFTGPKNTQELIAQVQEVMPMNPLHYEILCVKGQTSAFSAKIDVRLKSEEHINAFINGYGSRNNETLRISKTKRISTVQNPFQLVKYFRCHHNTRYEATSFASDILTVNPSKRFKNTSCPFSLIIRLRKNPEETEMSSVIDLEWNHNHSVKSLQSLTFKDIPDSIVHQIKDMFSRGLLPGAAHKELMHQLRSECKNDLEYHQRLADRSEIPRRKDFNDIYSDFKKELYGTGSLSTMFSTLQQRIEVLKEKDEGYTIEFQPFDEETNQPFVMVVITPLMKRVHQMVSLCGKILKFVYLF